MAPQLPTRKLGQNGPEVTAIGIGLMGLSSAYGKVKPDEERFAFLDHLYDSGQRFWDSADMYKDSEELLGRWFKKNPGKRDDIFLCTKFGNYVDPVTQARSARNEPAYVAEAIERSLKRLGVDCIDLWYCHRIQSSQPIEITVKEMKKYQDAGKVKYLGLSECSAETLRRASKVVRITAVQLEYSPWSMDIEDPQIDLLRTARELGVGLVAYSPLGRGFLTGQIRSPDSFEDGDFRKTSPRFSKENFHKNLELVDAISAIAKEKSVTNGQLILAWLLAQGDDIIPIPGTTKVQNYDENMAALNVPISSTDNERIRKAISLAEVRGTRYPALAMKVTFADTAPLNA